MKGIIATIGIIVALAVAGIAAGSVTYNGSTGFVGKGDVQLALGLNNAQMQAQASLLAFTYVSSSQYDVTAEFDTGNPDQLKSITHHVITVTRVSSVNDNVAYDTRTHKQVDGFYLTSTTLVSQDGNVPQVGDSFPDSLGTITAVDLVSTSGGLYVNGILLPIL